MLAALVITAFAGTGEKGFAGDGGPATKAKLDQPFAVVVTKDALYFSDTGNHCVRKVVAGTITTIAGVGGTKGFAGDGGPASKALLNEPYGLAVDAAGNVFVVDRLNACVRRVDAGTGVITTVAGVGGSKGFAGDGGPADKALLREPNGLCLDDTGKLYIADVADHRVRVVDLSTGRIATLAGSGKKLTAGDGGPLAGVSFSGPRAVAVGPDGSLYVVERDGHCVRRVNLAAGTIERFAGTGKKGYTGDGGPATAATFDGPKEIAVDKFGNVFVVDTENEAIRAINAKSGVIVTVAGKGRTKTPGLGDGGPATAATLGRPHGVAVGPDGALYIGDTNSHRVRVVK